MGRKLPTEMRPDKQGLKCTIQELRNTKAKLRQQYVSVVRT
jgi:hypothetical protein